MVDRPVALVTGGSRGIGRGICLALAESGYNIAINFAGNQESAEETRMMMSPEVEGLLCQGDVSLASDRIRIVDGILDRWGRIDVLVNNAGITSVGRQDILEAGEESWDRVMGVNLKGPYFLTQLVVRSMLDRLANLYLPTIVNISSLSAYALSMNRGDYCISKAGLAMLTQLFAARVADDGIRVFEVRPGIIETDMTAGGRDKYTRLISEGLTPIRRWGTPADVGSTVAMLVGNAFPFSTGEVINVDGGFHLRRFPV